MCDRNDAGIQAFLGVDVERLDPNPNHRRKLEVGGGPQGSASSGPDGFQTPGPAVRGQSSGCKQG